MRQATKIDKTVEETLKDSPMKAYFENEPYKSVDIYADTKERIRHALTHLVEEIVNQLKDKAHEMDFGGYVKAVLLDDILAILPDNKAYTLKKDSPNIGKETGDYYNGEYAETIEELLTKGVIEEEI